MTFAVSRPATEKDYAEDEMNKRAVYVEGVPLKKIEEKVEEYYIKLEFDVVNYRGPMKYCKPLLDQFDKRLYKAIVKKFNRLVEEEVYIPWYENITVNVWFGCQSLMDGTVFALPPVEVEVEFYKKVDGKLVKRRL